MRGESGGGGAFRNQERRGRGSIPMQRKHGGGSSSVRLGGRRERKGFGTERRRGGGATGTGGLKETRKRS
ncbi:uncharacterized protein DS421_19g648460 [Arachis hypogaea]|uniref:Uncharacterized protein n=1 Tax=Arachis hypogaea TaxID=3818 RepID=A0A6B9V7D9_ARAHY|nr:uncharacterized protein DS421_19g648460 [Arachis hypogaea]